MSITVGNEMETMISSINSKYSFLSPTEQKIAEFVMQNPEKVIYLSVTQVADELEVAQSTVTRFCRSIGLRGYQELKIKLARDMDNKNKPEFEEGKMLLSQKLAQIAISNIQDSLRVIDLEEMQKAITKLLAARKIVIFGLGESGPIANLLKFKLIGLGLAVDAHTDVHLQLISAAHLNNQDVAIGISQMGSTMDVVNAMKKARESGAHTICITGQGRSPIIEFSDIRLVCMGKGISELEKDLRSKVALLFLVELLVISVTLQLSGQESQAEHSKTTESILEKLY